MQKILYAAQSSGTGTNSRDETPGARINARLRVAGTFGICQKDPCDAFIRSSIWCPQRRNVACKPVGRRRRHCSKLRPTTSLPKCPFLAFQMGAL